MNEYVLGDPHGGFKALMEVIEKSKFDYEKDKMIVIGDVCDGWPETPQCFEELLKMKNLVYITGNHDKWALSWMQGKFDLNNPSVSEADAWLHHGGKATKEAYLAEYDLIAKHREFLETKSKLYYLDEQNRLFVHGGFDEDFPIDQQHETMYYWDREFWQQAYMGRNVGKNFKEVYLGHTPTLNFPQNDGSHYLPMSRKNVYNVDTGAAFTGKLSLMEINSKEVFQSDYVMKLYPTHKGRNGRAYDNILYSERTKYEK